MSCVASAAPSFDFCLHFDTSYGRVGQMPSLRTYINRSYSVVIGRVNDDIFSTRLAVVTDGITARELRSRMNIEVLASSTADSRVGRVVGQEVDAD